MQPKPKRQVKRKKTTKQMERIMNQNLESSQWAKKAINCFTDIVLAADKIKKHKPLPVSLTRDIEFLKSQVNQIDTDLTIRDLFKVKLNTVLREVYALVKDTSALTKKEKKEFRRSAMNIAYTPTNSAIAPVTRQIGFGAELGQVSRQTQSYPSVPTLRKEFTVEEGGVTDVIKGNATFSGVPDIMITRMAFNKLKIWCESLDDEVQALGIVHQENGDFFIKDFFLFNQVVSKTAVEEKNAQAIVDLMIEAESKGYNSRDLKVWWHSHNSMGVTPSAQDLATTKKYCGASGFLISLISNHRGEFNTKITFMKPFEFELTNVPLKVQDEGMNAEFIKEQQDLIRKHVEIRKTYSAPEHNSMAGYWSGVRDYDDREWNKDKQVWESKRKFEPLIDSYNGPDTDMYHQPLSVESIDKEFEDQFNDAMIVSAVEKGEAPFDANFQEGNISYCWNSTKRRYDMQNEFGRILTAADLDAIGAANYNKTIDDAIEAMRNGTVPSTKEGA
jgi:hypothetical protein